MNFGRRDSQQQLLLSLATHGIMLFITCKRLAQWHHLNLWTMKLTLTARKQDDQWVASITPADFFIDNEGSLMTIKDMLIQQISLQRLRRICVYRNKTKIIIITLIMNWLKTLDLRDMMGYNKKSSKEPKKYLKRNGAPFTPESSTRKSPRLLLSKQLSTTREDIANDSSTDSKLSPSQLSAFTSPVPADILLNF